MTRGDFRTGFLFGGQNAALDLPQRLIGYLEEKGWRVESRKPHWCVAAKGRGKWYGEPGSYDWQATRVILPSLVYTFYFHAQIKPADQEMEMKRRDWERRRRELGYNLIRVTNEEEFYRWYIDQWNWLDREAMAGVRAVSANLVPAEPVKVVAL